MEQNNENIIKCAIEEQINENRVNAPVVTMDLRSRHPETGEDLVEHREGEGVIALMREGMAIDEDGYPCLASSITILGGFSKFSAERIVINLIKHLDTHYPGIKKSITSILALDGLKDILNSFDNQDDEDDED